MTGMLKDGKPLPEVEKKRYTRYLLNEVFEYVLNHQKFDMAEFESFFVRALSKLVDKINIEKAREALKSVSARLLEAGKLDAKHFAGILVKAGADAALMPPTDSVSYPSASRATVSGGGASTREESD